MPCYATGLFFRHDGKALVPSPLPLCCYDAQLLRWMTLMLLTTFPVMLIRTSSVQYCEYGLEQYNTKTPNRIPVCMILSFRLILPVLIQLCSAI